MVLRDQPFVGVFVYKNKMNLGETFFIDDLGGYCAFSYPTY